MGKLRAIRITLSCSYLPCSQPFRVIPSRGPRAKYCSRQCQTLANAQIWVKQAAAIRITRRCAIPECGNTFTVKPSDARRKNVGIYCSRACQGLGAGPRRSRDLATRFWEKVTIADPDACWLWQGGTFGNGYGKIWVAERQIHVGAHVVSWFLAHQQWPEDGINICHSCDTPPCINIRHLWSGTQQANLADAGAKGHMSHTVNRRRGEMHWLHQHPEHALRGERNGNARLTDAQIQEAIALYATGMWTQTQLAQRYGVRQTTISRRLQHYPQNQQQKLL